MNKNYGIIKNILILLKPYRKKLLISLSCTVVITAVSMAMPILTERLMDNGVMALNLSQTIKYVGYMILLVLLNQGVSFLQQAFHIDIQNKLQFDLEMEAFDKSLRMNIESFNEEGFSAIFNTLSWDIENMVQVADENFFIAAMEILKIIGGLIGLIAIHYKLTLFIILLLPLKFILMNKLSKIKMKTFEGLIEVIEKIGCWYGDRMNGIVEIKLWNLYSKEQEKYSKLLKEKLKLNKKVQLLNEVNSESDTLLQALVSNLIYIVGVAFILKQELTIGGLIAFIMYSNLVIGPISLIVSLKYQLANIKPSFENYFKFLDEKGETSSPLQGLKNSGKLPKRIYFEEVSLAYKEKYALEGVSLELKAGEKVAFIGHNGSGKTSLMNLLLRLYKPTKGKIYLDETDIEEIDLEQYRDLFAVMGQQVYLFNTTIKENINLVHDLSEEEIEKLCQEKQITSYLDFVKKAPEQFETLVGLRGDKLSGGQKQKIALIRTLLKPKSQILILDEATSNYDMEAEEVFNEVIKRCSYPFVFVITHRPEMLCQMDKIVVLEKGQIMAVGTYEELIHNNQMANRLLNDAI